MSLEDNWNACKCSAPATVKIRLEAERDATDKVTAEVKVCGDCAAKILPAARKALEMRSEDLSDVAAQFARWFVFGKRGP